MKKLSITEVINEAKRILTEDSAKSADAQAAWDYMLDMLRECATKRTRDRRFKSFEVQYLSEHMRLEFLQSVAGGASIAEAKAAGLKVIGL